METNGIDLTKCNNCRFRAVVDGKEVTGRIEKSKTSFLLTGYDWFVRAVTPAELDNLLRGADLTVEDEGSYISGFEIVPRDPETYKDWQVGDIIGFEDEDGEIDTTPEHLCRVIFRSGELVAIADNCEDADINGVYTCSQLYREGWRLILTDIERQIIEDRKKAEWKPQDGDVCFVKTAAGNCFIFIKRSGEDEDEMYKYASIDTNSQYLFPAGVKCVCRKEDIRELRPATDEEKQKLFDAMSKEGKRWNAEKKVVEDIPRSYKFRKGEPVLVRDYEIELWRIAAYDSEYKKGFLVNTGKSVVHWKQCIPYNERTMHLLGTTEDYKEGV